MHRCAWKDIESDQFVLGMTAKRCGKLAAIKVLRPHRKTDLLLCESHLNEFIRVWGLHNQVELLHGVGDSH